ncbi:MAG TPA: HU family DNA-binding protein [Acidobacteriota bacterium]
MTKQQFVAEVAKSNKHPELSKKALEQLIDSVFATAAKAIKKNRRLTYPQFGTFVLRHSKSRKGRNPKTGEVMLIRASKTVRFRPAAALKKQL